MGRVFWNHRKRHGVTYSVMTCCGLQSHKLNFHRILYLHGCLRCNLLDYNSANSQPRARILGRKVLCSKWKPALKFELWLFASRSHNGGAATFCVGLWQTWMNVLWMTETAVHRRTAPTRLEALTVPVLMDIPAMGSLVQVTITRLRYIFCLLCSKLSRKRQNIITKLVIITRRHGVDRGPGARAQWSGIVCFVKNRY